MAARVTREPVSWIAARPEFTGTAPAGTLIQLFIDTAGNGDATDPLNEIIGTGTAGGDGTWSITSTVDLIPSWTSSIKARGQDDAGNFGAASSSVDVTIDITPPAAVPSAPNLMAAGDTGWLTSTVQLGFVAGTAVAALASPVSSSGRWVCSARAWNGPCASWCSARR